MLKLIIELCRTSEDLTPEDRAAELLPIAVQQLYVLIKQGKSEEAESILEEMTVKEYVPTIGNPLKLTRSVSPSFPQRRLPRTISLLFATSPTRTASTRQCTKRQMPLTVTNSLTSRTTLWSGIRSLRAFLSRNMMV